jgi:phosphate transport system substrate-binding protein
MVDNFNYVKCPKCGHDRNPSTAYKCEICGQKLRAGFPIVPLIGVGLAALVAVGAYFFLKSRQPDTTNVQNTPSTPTPTLQSPTPITPVTTPPPQTQTTPPLVTGAIVTTYRSLAEVPNVPQGSFNYGGSTTFAPLRSPDVATAINQAFPQFKLIYTDPPTGKPGSGEGIKMLLEGQLSFSQSSRSVKDEEFASAKNRGFTLEQVPVGIDGIAFYVNPELIAKGVKGITLAQARDIFTGKVKNWQEVGGPNIPIAPFSRNLQAGGTVDFFSEKVLEKQPLGANVKEVPTTTLSIREVATNPGGIGYATASEVINQKTIRLLPLAKEANQPFVSVCTDQNCTEVNQTAFTDNSYPITRRLFVIIKRDGKLDEQAGVAYANMILSDQGQKFVQQKGFVPIR